MKSETFFRKVIKEKDLNVFSCYVQFVILKLTWKKATDLEVFVDGHMKSPVTKKSYNEHLIQIEKAAVERAQI